MRHVKKSARKARNKMKVRKANQKMKACKVRERIKPRKAHVKKGKHVRSKGTKARRHVRHVWHEGTPGT